MGEYVSVAAENGAFQVYVARPVASPAPVVVVVQEIFGVNKDLRATCDELAAQGYIAMSPDLFWRLEPGLDMNALNDEEWKKGFALYNVFNLDTGVQDILRCVAAARTLPGASGRVGVMGFCLGGLLTFLTTARGQVDASVAYYGGATENHLEEAARIQSPMIMHLGEEDEYISKDAQAKIAQAVQGNPHVRIYSYPGCSHAFARHGGQHYDAAAAALANGRTYDFFKKHLQ